uniref:AAA family ATPase n=1 Tax=Ignisphaera aggregans TaxID=334771 RepID=A0A7J3I9B6_9CREN
MNQYVFGIDDLDKFYGDVLHPGSMIVIAGHPGSGKTTLASTICYANAVRGYRCLYISLQETKEKLFRVMKRLRIDLEDVELRGLLRFIKLPIVLDINGIESISGVLLEYKPSIVIIDSINALLQSVKDDAKRAWLQNYFYEMSKSIDGITILIAEVPYGEEKIELGSVEFVSDAIFILKHQVVRGILNRIIEIRKARGAPITLAEIPFSISQNVGLEVWMPPLLEEILPQEIELRLPCRLLEKLWGHLHKGHIVYIEHPAHARIADYTLLLLGILAVNNLRAVAISYGYSPETVIDILGRTYTTFSTAPNRDAIEKFVRENIVVKSYNPFAYGIYRLFSEELALIRRTPTIDAIIFHGAELPALVEPMSTFIPIPYNQLNAFRKQGLLVIRIASYINEELHNIFSTISDVVLRFRLTKPINGEYRYRIYVWRRGSNPHAITYDEFQECLREVCKTVESVVRSGETSS